MTDEETIRKAIDMLRGYQCCPYHTYIPEAADAAELALQRLVAKGKDAVEAWKELWTSQSSH